jgi:nucleoredoxin
MNSSLLDGKLLSKDGEINFSSIEAVVFCVYFSASWCPPCKAFTPKLANLYNDWNINGKIIEIIFASSDRDEKSFKDYFATMPWVAIPFGDERIKKLKEECEVQGIPSFCLVNSLGMALYPEGRDLIDDKGIEALNDLLDLSQ